MEKPNLLDRFFDNVAPEYAVKRAKAKVAIEALRAYEAASKGRRTDGWFSNSGSANTENWGALRILRDRSRQLVRDNPYAKKAMQAIGTNTIGAGIIPSIKAKDDAQKKKIKQVWEQWAETSACDWNGKMNFYGIQSLVMQSVARDGEVLVLIRRTTDKIPVKLQVIEADYLDHNRNYPDTGSNEYTIQGVTFNQKGKIIKYWLFDRHPGEVFVKSAISKQVDAKNVIHIYKSDRPGQVRGVPFGTSAMARLKDFDDYEDAQLMRQKIAACWAVFVTSTSDALNGKTSKGHPLSDRVEPGIIETLDPGQTVEFASPPGADGYAEYSRKILQAIAAGYGVTYEAMTGDLSGTNFSSGRMGWLEFHRNITDWQYNMVIPQLCEPVWNLFVDLAGSVAGLFQPKGISTSWTPPRREMIDPKKEADGLSILVRNGFLAWDEAVRGQGFDPEQVLKDISYWKDKCDTAGLFLACDPEHDANRAAPKVDNGGGG